MKFLDNVAKQWEKAPPKGSHHLIVFLINLLAVFYNKE